MKGPRELLGRNLPPRVALVQRELDRLDRPRYLEIGVNVGVLFLHVRAYRKVGVDPVRRIPGWKWWAHPNTALRGRFVTATSDEFFAGLDQAARFDVVFIDGLHTHEQSARDVANALAHLDERGVVLVHDCNPASAEAAGTDPDASEGRGWCGEVWKTIVELRATREDLAVEVLDSDHGIGVVRRGRSTTIALPRPPGDLTYADLSADRERLLGLRANRASARAP
ncbi:MAG: class I SAM-dependent methyltransferase [Solirubrobacterales bacterium]